MFRWYCSVGEGARLARKLSSVTTVVPRVRCKTDLASGDMKMVESGKMKREGVY